jgi:hypothetical protein
VVYGILDDSCGTFLSAKITTLPVLLEVQLVGLLRLLPSFVALLLVVRLVLVLVDLVVVLELAVEVIQRLLYRSPYSLQQQYLDHLESYQLSN